jgi:hypothetical protein
MYAFQSSKRLLISEPSICLGAAWIPYRRNQQLMRDLLRQCQDTQAANVGAVFCHADVKGAFMNDGMRSKDGINISDFPSNVPLFSGHFHKPHSVSCLRSIQPLYSL